MRQYRIKVLRADQAYKNRYTVQDIPFTSRKCAEEWFNQRHAELKENAGRVLLMELFETLKTRNSERYYAGYGIWKYRDLPGYRTIKHEGITCVNYGLRENFTEVLRSVNWNQE